MATKELFRVGTVPNYLVRELTDRGMSETQIGEHGVDKDDLRLAIQLSGDHVVILAPGQHIAFTRDEVEVWEYFEVETE